MPLHVGANQIDVVASASGEAPVSESVTVTRTRARRGGTSTSTVVTVTSTPPPASSTQTSSGDWTGSGYTAVLASVSGQDQARAIQRRASDAGLDAGVLYSSGYRSLRPGYWVVYSGHFDTQPQASARASRAKSLGFGDAYPRYVSP